MSLPRNDISPNGSIAPAKSEIKSLQSNSFHNLSTQEFPSEDITDNGTNSNTISGILQPPQSPVTPPPRKRTKKDPNKV